jgi:hypothetical protein
MLPIPKIAANAGLICEGLEAAVICRHLPMTSDERVAGSNPAGTAG